MNENNLENFEKWQFAGDKENCDKLFDLVKSGRKTATCFLYEGDLDFDEFSILTNWDKSQMILLKTTNYIVKRFCDVTHDHALKEGESDGSLKQWREVHENFFKERCKQKKIQFDQNILIVYEEFEVVEFL